MKKALLASLISAVTLAPIAAHAVDGTLSFNGSITGQTCVINGGNPDMTVTLPRLSTSSLKDGQQAGFTPFQIVLTQCDPATGRANTYFEYGPSVDTTTNQLKIDTAAGSARNVQIRLMNDDATSSQILVGKSAAEQNSKDAAITGGNATLKYVAAYSATGGAATAGAVTTRVRYSMQYN